MLSNKRTFLKFNLKKKKKGAKNSSRGSNK